MKKPCAVNVHNVVTVGQQGLGRRVTQLSKGKMRQVCVALAFALGCEE